MRNRLKHKNNSKTVLNTDGDETGKWAPTQESINALENIKALGRREIADGRPDSPISRAVKLLVEEVEKAWELAGQLSD